MVLLLRHLLAIAILPGTVMLLVPVWIARRYGAALALGESPGQVVLQCVGFALLAVGLLLFLASVQLFATEGKGTLAPWDPPRALVVRGPYRFVRNPMISGVIFILFGAGLTLLSLQHGVWAATFLTLNLVYIPLMEEPQLERRFGESYREYRRHVRRFLPRLGPWVPGARPLVGVNCMSSYPRQGLKGASPGDMAWLTGSWYADVNGDAVEEHWSPLRGNMLMAMFRWIRNGKVLFYEIEALEAEGEYVYLRVRHFDPGLVGWEERTKPHEFLLVEQEAARLVFYELDKPDPRWAVYERRGPDELIAYFTHGSDPDPEPGVFRFGRGSPFGPGPGAA